MVSSDLLALSYFRFRIFAAATRYCESGDVLICAKLICCRRYSTTCQRPFARRLVEMVYSKCNSHFPSVDVGIILI
jgi:hypothetical protein